MTARARGASLTLMMAFMVLAGPAAAAWAHPLGNFSVNVHSGLRLLPDEVRLTAIVDTAEIPTRQARPELDTDGDDSLSSRELSAAAGSRCSTLAGQLSAVVDGTALAWTIDSADLVAPEGTAGLPTLRLTCALSAPAELDTPTTLAYRDVAGDGRVGWHEIVAVGEGVELVDPSVGTVSPSDELRSYPEELLESPLDQRAVELVLRPGSGTTGTATASPDAPGGEGDALAGLLASGDRLLQNTLGREDLTASVGLLAVLLAVLLGAGHAVLPGHGKTVMAAYLAGRDGTRSDAFVVGATVTLTHTLGVLALGLVVSVGTAVAGERVLARLGLISGLLVAGIGASMLRDALRGRAPGHGHHHGHGHDHEHGDGHTHGHGHGHDGHGHDHGPMTPSRGAAEGDLVVLDRAEPTTPTIVPADGDRRTSRRGLVGMAVAGGLVPSPSALVVLLASVALGRTLLGVSLVLAYGLGMAGTLTAVGLLLVRLRDRFSTVQHGRLGRLAAGLGRVLPALTATLVLVVGLGLAARALIG